ncbi:MAG: alpha/beta fold hydrolase [Desulfovibrio sp.]
MPHVTTRGIQIEYDTIGDKSSPALLLIAGNGAQLTFWDEPFCRALADTGLFVIRFDNRDAGLSTKFDAAGVPDFMACVKAAMEGKPVESAYTLEDMADDCAGLLEGLGIDKAHICGLSMGGMIAQVVACRHPEHVRSLTSIMSCTGNPEAPQGKPEAIAAVVATPPEGREAFIEHNINVWRKVWSPGFPFEEERARKFMEESYDRCHYLPGMARQNTAILANGDRRRALAALTVPALVIHGAADPLIPVGAGEDTARTIPGARLLVIEGMGHDLPTPVWPQVIDAISQLTKQATA